MSCDLDENGQMVLEPTEQGEIIQKLLDDRAARLRKHKEREENQPSAARQTAQYLSFGRTRLRKMIQAQQHAEGLMKKPYSEAILQKRLASKAHQTTEQARAAQAAAPLPEKIKPKKRIKARRR